MYTNYDRHYGEAPETDWGPGADLKSTNVTSKILDYEQPDFVVFTGDQLTAENMFPNASEYVHMLLQPLLQRNLRLGCKVKVSLVSFIM